jgi:prevent-host-death family protein
MARSVTATEAKAKILALLDAVEGGEEIEITRRGRLIARLVPARSAAALRGRYRGLAWQTVSDDELLEPIDEAWGPADWLDEASPRQ